MNTFNKNFIFSLTSVRYDFFMEKDFESWNKLKSEIDLIDTGQAPFCWPKELWICSIGVNVGSEQNGTGLKFSRPVLVLKVFNRETFWGIPITTQKCHNKPHIKFNLGGVDQCALISHIRLFSVKRLERRITIMPDNLFEELTEVFISLLPKNNLPHTGEVVAGTIQVS